MQRAVFTDLDGTLLDDQWNLSEKNRGTLIKLIDKGVIRVIVTGRSLYSAQRVLGEDFPIDYLIFSTGAGMMNWQTGEIFYSKHISGSQVKACVEILYREEINFMLHREIPDSHHFLYYKGNNTPADFQQRLTLYAEFGQPYNLESQPPLEATQFLSILTPQSFDIAYQSLSSQLTNLSIIKTTSPLLKGSLWLEIYAAEVSKGNAVNYLAQQLKLSNENSLVIGNDFNDSDMLDWGCNSFVVANAPESLKEKYIEVAANTDDGFSEAVEKWLAWN